MVWCGEWCGAERCGVVWPGDQVQVHLRPVSCARSPQWLSRSPWSLKGRMLRSSRPFKLVSTCRGGPLG